jgi:uncharacterized protein (DUF2126 family)/transglutaminase-like putative cysteine protease
MSIRVALHHLTEYVYDRNVTLLPHVVRLRPAPHCRTKVLSYSLKVEPAEHFLNWQQDPYSNYCARFVFPKPATKLHVEVDLIAEMVAINPFDFFLEEDANKVPFRYDDQLRQELLPYLEIKESDDSLRKLVEEVRPKPMPTVDFLVDVNQRLNKAVNYVIRMEPGIQTCAETLDKRSGSCRDSAWLMVQLLRHLGMAARFVSGYLIQLTADQPALDGPSGPKRDFTDLHAWAEVYLPGAGWVGLDPTSGLLAGEGHLPLAATADPQNAAPITGIWVPLPGHVAEEVSADFRFGMSVRRVHELPRVTKPYTEEQWLAIDTAGRAVDQELEAADVRLTMGGEPTFVSIDDKDGAEWNTAAMGPTKRLRADDLLRRLRDRFAPGALLHFGQGKWYPGESLPRWAFGCYWRKDGEPIWWDPSLVAEERRDYGYGPDDAAAFIRHLAAVLGVDPEHATPGYEDAWYYLWREGRLPTNVDPLKSRLDDPEERARLARVFEQGLNKVVGYALPLRRERRDMGDVWVSGRWFLRREHLFLTPGDSPMGYRLPLDSLPWMAPELRSTVIAQDLWEDRGPLPRRVGQAFLPAETASRMKPFQGLVGRNAYPTGEPTGPDPVVRLALCVEPRGGRLHVFMPPQRTAEYYLDLVAAIETTAKDLLMPVMIEGYTPPHDSRLLHFKITPDPGVIEVNVHPAANWPELTNLVTTVYDEARQARLCAEKFMIDGRHVGTGGGNHIVLGGPSPADSPILRRPDLLRSLVSYWHNHPSLSYLFAGLFIGPTSQAPRVDEARNDSLYELELAGSLVPEHGGCPPWLVDRVFRNLLIDVTGNTHRAEWCIDKLYAPDTGEDRRGLVEFRAFEMPPHSRMSLTQHLLLRALIARFWKTPYKQKLIRWGTQLHDRFLLPHFVSQDFQDVLEELNREGYPLQEEWFASHFEFRFPSFGSIVHDSIQLELRSAIEPWHVMGDEPGGGGTVRFVDSSVERLQVKVRGMIDPRHIVACNGRKVPLHPTGVQGEFVAGVRFRAWQPPSCLHPTIPVHTPLVFDLLDTWMQRSLGGCTYHVSHPGGRHFDTFPVNANEAEGRRIARFFPLGHTVGAMPVPTDELHAEFPLTLDLRQPAPPRPAVSPEVAGTRGGYSVKMNGKPAATPAPSTR